MGELRIFLKH